jgi:hypothetical protein
MTRDRLPRKGLARVIGLVQLLQEVLGEKLRIAVALAQRRQLDREYGEPIHQVFAQLAVANGLLRVAVRRRDDARPRAQLLLAADARVAARLEHAQQAHLHLRRHFRHFVEKSVPPSARSKHPRCIRAAPVNAPFS